MDGAGRHLRGAYLRGGGEYGKEWHDAGRLAKKQNVFDDFIACGRVARPREVTPTPKLGHQRRRRNGGLLVGASITSARSCSAAALAEVGVMDMLRFHKFTIGWAWTSDYGSADDPESTALRAYSPLHNLRAGTPYPPTLVTTGDHDDRVVPVHSFKFAGAAGRAGR